MTEEKEKVTTHKGVSRRQFIAGTVGGLVVGAAAGAVTGSLGFPKTITAQPWLPAKWDYTTDVAVVGFGGAGGAAALEAYDAGAKVIILEKTPTPGGSTSICAGVCYAGGTSLQKQYGIDDSADGMYAYAMAIGKGYNDPNQVRAWADNSAATIDWLVSMSAKWLPGTAQDGSYQSIDMYGLYYSGSEPDPEFAAITPPKMRGHNVQPVTPNWPWPPKNNMYTKYGTGFFSPLYNGVQKRGIQVLLETQAKGLIADPTTKEVLGVKATAASGDVYIQANRGVVLATGGFGMNKDMVQRYCPGLGAGGLFTPSDTGDGIQMGMALGADLVNMDEVVYILNNGPSGAIWVNDGGRRFVDETLNNDGSVAAQAFAGQRDSLAYAIFDSTLAKGVTGATQAPTIAALASAVGIDPTVLTDEVNTYNGYVKAGIDLEFGRVGQFCRPNTAPMVPIVTPPFFALKITPSASAVGITMGGLRINPQAQVIDTFGNVIPRLYAAGSTSGGNLGKIYPGSGSMVSQALTFGRIAGQNVAKETPHT